MVTWKAAQIGVIFGVEPWNFLLIISSLESRARI